MRSKFERNSISKEVLIILLSFCACFSLVERPDYFLPMSAVSAMLFLMIYLLLRNIFFKCKFKKLNFFLSFFISLSYIIGYSFHKGKSIQLLLETYQNQFRTLICFIGFVVIFYIISELISYIKVKYLYDFKGLDYLNKYKFYKTHPKLSITCLILICWLPYIIILYPGLMSPDGNVQVSQFFGVDTSSILGVVENVSGSVITGHHPIAITYLFGFFVKVGKLLGNDNLGLYIFVLIQTLCMSILFSHVISYLNSLKIHKVISVLALLGYALLPFFPQAAMTMVKDSVSICFFILFTLCVLKICNQDKVNWLTLFVSLIGMALSRKEYVYIILIELGVILFSQKSQRKKICITLLCFLFFNSGYNYIVFDIMEIPKGSTREMLSIPFQQTARLIWEKGYDVIEDEDKVLINKVLDGENLGKLYKPIISDPVKATFNEKATKEDLLNYFKIWGKYGLRYPNIYISATINNTYGYFYLDRVNSTGYMDSSDIVKSGKFNFTEPEILKPIRTVFVKANELLRLTAPFNILCRIALYTWLLISVVFYIIKRKKYANITPIIPFILILCVCIISPVSGNFRYAYGMIFGFPLIMAIGSIKIDNKNDVFEKIAGFIVKYREVLIYLIVGILTTIVSIASYYLFSHSLQINYLISNFFSWICAVIFAYFTNKTWVFQNRNYDISYLKKEFISFTGSRVLTLLIDMLIMFVIVTLLNMNDMIGKIIVQVVVTILNYVFSKFFVFKKEVSNHGAN